MNRRQVLIAAGAGLAAACAPEGADEPAALRVFAATSLVDVLKAAGDLLQQIGGEELGATPPVMNFAATSDLARQIIQGARADLFISADEAWIDELDARALLVRAERRVLAGNRLVVIAPADAPFEIDLSPGVDIVSALKGGRIAIAEPETVPAGRYAREAFTALGVWDEVKSAAAYGESVRSALRLVELGEAAAGVVYATDARASRDLVRVAGVFDPALHTPIIYPMAPVAAGDVPAAVRLMAFLLSPPAQAVFAEFGFLPPDVARVDAAAE
ncbi:molybdate ABC transporter substrate-binding protein [bacterium]|nr:molybdate ABC transporter substrate-binding protein [bacterium]